MEKALNVDIAVRERYSSAAKAQEAALCCPIDYDPKYLKAIPKEVIERDYGCGDPSRYVREGETVLDLGSGTGKICFIASQIVGAKGRVIGVDMNDDMLGIARNSAKEVAKNIGFANTEFYKGKIQELSLNRDKVDQYLVEHPVKSENDLQKLESFIEDQKKNYPLIPDNSIDVVVSNCVLNLVGSEEKEQLFKEIFRVLKRGGRAVISDIVSDEFVPMEMQNNAELWSGCLSGAYQESAFLKAFEQVGFYGVTLDKRDEKPWQTVEGIEFRSVTVVAFKGKEGECWDHSEALIYKGPFKSVVDDDGHEFRRGEPVAVCRKTFEIYSRPPYTDLFFQVRPLTEVSQEDARPFDCSGGDMLRRPEELKGKDYKATNYCGPGCC